MKNATLIVNDSEKFSDDIWQCKSDFTETQWQDAMESFAISLQDIYNWLDENEEFDMPDCLYVLGDVINMLHNIDVKRK